MISLSGKNFDFTEFKNSVKSALQNRTPRQVAPNEHKEAAVLILMFEKDNSPHILVTKRSEKVATHKGQMSLPGGSLDQEDADIQETIFRETEEETGIHRSKIEIIGRFDEYLSISGFHITVFIGCTGYPVEYNFNIDEIVDHVEVPLEIFTKHEGLEFDTYAFFGGNQKIYRYMYKGNMIWGLTSIIVTEFVEKIIVT
jgi:8-oxo-dGTP pyrophosphatase MutT (NUDIX family)